MLLQTNTTVLSGKRGLPLRSNRRKFVTSDFFPVASHPLVNAVLVTSLYGVIVNDLNPQIKTGAWNQLVTGCRVLLAWLNNGFWNGAHDGRTDNNKTNQILPRDALSLPRDLFFSLEGQLL